MNNLAIKTAMLTIDGSQLEGGGQIIRVSVALSSILCKSVKIHGIRAGRSKPGLAAQHLSGVRLVKQISSANVIGADIGSIELQFNPVNDARKGKYFEDCGTAGSITLMAQIAIPCVAVPCELGKEVELELWGGTNVSHSPPIDHLQHILFPLLHQFGITTSMNIMRRGYYPRGGGRVSLTITPPAQPSLSPINMTEQGSLQSLTGIIFGNVPLALRQLTAEKLSEQIYLSPLIGHDGSRLDSFETTIVSSPEDNNSFSNPPRREKSYTLGMQLVAVTSTGCRLSANVTLSQKTITEHNVAEIVNSVLTEWRETCLSGACVDEHTADQLIIYISQCNGISRLLTVGTVTSMHLETAIKITQDITGVRYTVEEVESTSSCNKVFTNKLITCYGMESDTGGNSNSIDNSTIKS